MAPAIRLTCITFFYASGILAQTNKATLSLQLTFPQGDYKKTYPVTASGLLFGITHRMGELSPFSAGGEVGILQVSGDNKNYTGYYDNEYNTYLVASWNHIFTIGGTCRMELLNPEASWALHIDVTAGANIFVTANSVSRDLGIDLITHTSIVRYYFLDTDVDVAFRAGGGLGVEIPFGKRKSTAISLKGSYLYGSPANYYARPHIVDGGRIEVAPRESETSMILAEAGVRFYLGK